MRKMEIKKDPLEVIGCSKGYTHEELKKNLHRHSKYSPEIKRRVRGVRREDFGLIQQSPSSSIEAVDHIFV